MLISACLAMPGLSSAADGHEHHHHEAGAAMSLVKRTQQVALPDLQVVRMDGKRMKLAAALDDGRPIVLNFIYTSCTAICPVTSQVLMEFREQIGAERDRINMVSISIDPEQDSPKRLTQYAKRFGSAGTWAHYTGSTQDSETIQRAFEAWRGDKMNHQPLTFIRAVQGGPWLRLDGFMSPGDLVSEYRQFVTQKK
jgi:protein SCO1/2